MRENYKVHQFGNESSLEMVRLFGILRAKNARDSITLDYLMSTKAPSIKQKCI